MLKGKRQFIVLLVAALLVVAAIVYAAVYSAQRGRADPWTGSREYVFEAEDAALENVLNRYCLMLSEHDGLVALLSEARAALEELKKMRDAMPPEVWLERLQKQTEQVLGLETAVRKKRDQLLAVEKENLLTAQSKIRAVPKKKAE